MEIKYAFFSLILPLGVCLMAEPVQTGTALDGGNWQSIFPSATELGDGWISGDWAGLTYAGSEPWYYSTTHGWLYSPGGDWFFDAGRASWTWTRSGYFPNIYQPDTGEWLYYSGGDTPERIFYHHFGASYLVEQPDLKDLAEARSRGVLAFAEGQHRNLLLLVPAYDQSVELYPENDGWKIVPTGSWVSGFFPACLWLDYNWSGRPLLKLQGERRLDALEVVKTRTTTHDLGFMIGLPFSLAYKMTGKASYRDVIVTAAGSLATRYNATVGATRSWSHGTWDDGDSFTVIIDNMMNMELLLRAASFSGESQLRTMALTHARTTLREHIRDDGSTYHVVVFDQDDGLVKSKVTAQGYDAESTWARGQAWAVHGFAMMYEFTGEADMRDAAIKVATYFIDHLPDSWIAPWDFKAPGVDIPTDTSATSIAAAGLLRLASALGDENPFAQTCRDTAYQMLIALSRNPYLAVGTDYGALLTGGSRANGQYDQSLIYGDYYLVEACQRLLGIFPAE